MKRKLKMKGAVISDIGQMKNWWNQLAKTVTKAPSSVTVLAPTDELYQQYVIEFLPLFHP